MSDSNKNSTKNINANELTITKNLNRTWRLKKTQSSNNETINTLTEEKETFEQLSNLPPSRKCYQNFASKFLNASKKHSPDPSQYESTSKNSPPFKKKRIKAGHNKMTDNINNNDDSVRPSSDTIHVIDNGEDINAYSVQYPLDENCTKPFNSTINVIDSEAIISDVEDNVELDYCSAAEEDDIDFNFLKRNSYEITQVNQHAFRITLYGEVIVYINGLISVRVLQGSIEILGYELTVSNETLNVYSPAGSSLLSISNKTYTSSSDATIILCDKLDTKLYRSLCLYGPKNIFPTLQGNGTYCIVSASNSFENFSLFVPSPEWDDITSALTSKSRVLIAGNKGTGKSTLLRYLVNHLLSKGENNTQSRVLVVDLDPGQSEFTPPGCISITIVKSPLLGPSYTHQQIPEKCIYISNIDVKYNMDEYIRSCKYLLSFMKEYLNIPAIVNYIGYSRGLGQELIATIISFVDPTNVVQLNDPDGRYNFRKDLSIDNVKEDANWIPHSTVENELGYELIQFETVHNYNKINSVIYTPGQLRDIAIVSYFNTILKGDPLCLTDPAVRIYSASLDKINIRDCMGNSHPAICNANLVSLCRKVSHEDKDIYDCLGWGVVRCVSIPRNTIYLLTPLNVKLFEHIEYIFVSSVRLPLAMYITTAKDISGQIPYIEGGQQTDLEKPSKRQHYNWDMANQ